MSKIKSVTFALRYNMLGDPVQTFTHVCDPEAQLHAMTIDIPKGFKRSAAVITTKFGQYRVIVTQDTKDQSITFDYNYRKTQPRPIEVQLS